jgi:hypothetical protein
LPAAVVRVLCSGRTEGFHHPLLRAAQLLLAMAEL